LTIHGVTNDVSVPGTIAVKGKEAIAKAKFSVKLGDYKVSIPSLVGDKVAKTATISVDAAMSTK
jgi:polyisoprenoid-binding protein YceI